MAAERWRDVAAQRAPLGEAPPHRDLQGDPGRRLLLAAVCGQCVRRIEDDSSVRREQLRIDPRLDLRQSYGRVLATTYFVKLITQMVERETALPAVFDLLRKALDYLHEKEPSPALIDRFEQRLAEELGIAGEGDYARAIEGAFHRRLPVQRAQLVKLVGSTTAGGGSRPAG